LWIEADFLFHKVAEGEDHSTVAPHFFHMRLDEPEGIPRMRFRLTATMGIGWNIEKNLVYFLDVNADSSPQTIAQVPRAERNNIQVHYCQTRSCGPYRLRCERIPWTFA